jgi:hypothetical protein
MNNETEIVSQLKARLQRNTSWSKNAEEYASTYGNLNPADIAGLDNDQLWKLWTATKFAETGTPSMPNPTAEQWEGVRKMTRLLSDRSQTLGERFNAARAVYRETFTADQVQLPVLLRTLLILEGGRYGTIAAKSHMNRLLQWAGKPEMSYSNQVSITGSLENVRAIIEEWAEKIGTESPGERACISWHLCEIIRDNLTASESLSRTATQNKEPAALLERRFWVEKTIVYGRPDRLQGEHALGKALWSPQASKDGKDIYKLMLEAQPGDIVFHLIDNKEIEGYSEIASSADKSFVGLPGTDWADVKCYRIPLTGHTILNPGIDRSEFLKNPVYQPILQALLGADNSVFYNINFDLNQGKYLTEAPLKLVQIWNEIHLQHTGQPINPEWNIPPLNGVSSAPIADNFSSLLYRYYQEQIIFVNSAEKWPAISQGGLDWGLVQGFDFLIGRQSCV